jgi:hypothetical protein
VIFNARPGELFVVRNVANLVPPYAPDGRAHGVSAALEFGVATGKLSVRDSATGEFRPIAAEDYARLFAQPRF